MKIKTILTTTSLLFASSAVALAAAPPQQRQCQVYLLVNSLPNSTQNEVSFNIVNNKGNHYSAPYVKIHIRTTVNVPCGYQYKIYATPGTANSSPQFRQQLLNSGALGKYWFEGGTSVSLNQPLQSVAATFPQYFQKTL